MMAAKMEGPASHHRSIQALVGSFLLVSIWLHVISGSYPTTDWDRGIFVSVAERLLRGDRLYVDVLDQKEPLFFYFVAAQRYFGFWAEWTAEVLLILAACLASWQIFVALRFPHALETAFVAVPLIITGGFYVPGYTHLPGLVLSLLALLFSLKDRPASAGFIVALVLATKITFGPVAAACCLVVFFFGKRVADDIFRAILGGVLGICLVSLLLAARGELHGFVEVFLDNVAYSQSALEALGLPTGLGGRIMSVSSPHLLAHVAALTVVLPELLKGDRRVLVLFCSALLATVAILATTSLWMHHGQALYFPALIAAGTLGRPFRSADGMRITHFMAIAAFGVLLGGSSPMYPSHGNNPANLEAEALLTIAGETGSYARLGSNSGEDGHARGLQGWDLHCPRFHMYAHLSAQVLTETGTCALSSPTLLLGRSFAPMRRLGEEHPWNRWVEDVEARVQQQFICTGMDGVRVCTRIDSVASRHR